MNATVFQGDQPPARALANSYLYQLVYVSSAVAPFSPVELVTLLEHSRRRNMAAGVSGLLLYHDGNFMQLLEGNEDAVRATHARIVRDDRHMGQITLLQGPVAERTFPDWSMGFRNLTSAEISSTTGYSGFLNSSGPDQGWRENPHRALKLLHMFRDNLR